MVVEILSKIRVGCANGGYYHRVKHASKSTGTDMVFGLFLPTSYYNNDSSSSPKTTTPVLFWLSGLTCDDTNFANKAGSRAFERAEKERIAIVMPDTSPRGNGDVPDVDSYDLGTGAGFYVDATEEPYEKHYKMYSYVTKELPALLEAEFDNLGSRGLKSISGHSMGGHGALTIALREPSDWVSVSALAPICNPTKAPWGKKAFEAYLGSAEAGKAHDATCLLDDNSGKTAAAMYDEILIDQGSADEFLDSQLFPGALEETAKRVGQNVTINTREGFDHSYHFVAAFIEDHVVFHGRKLSKKKSHGG